MHFTRYNLFSDVYQLGSRVSQEQHLSVKEKQPIMLVEFANITLYTSDHFQICDQVSRRINLAQGEVPFCEVPLVDASLLDDRSPLIPLEKVLFSYDG